MSGTLLRQRDLAVKAGRRNVWRWLRIGLGSAFLACVLAVVVAYGMAFHRPALPSTRTDPAVVEALIQKTDRARAAATSGQQSIVRVSEQELNSFLGAYVLRANNEVRDPSGARLLDARCHLSGDLIQVFVLVSLHEKEIALTMTGKLSSVGGRVTFEPVGGSIGSLPIPRSALEEAARQVLSSPGVLQSLKLPTYIRDLRVQGSEILLIYN